MHLLFIPELPRGRDDERQQMKDMGMMKDDGLTKTWMIVASRHESVPFMTSRLYSR